MLRTSMLKPAFVEKPRPASKIKTYLCALIKEL